MKKKLTQKKAAGKTTAKAAGKKAGKAAVKTPVKAAKSALTKSASARKKSATIEPARAREIMKLLCQKYPEADCELTFKNDFELLTAVILSAQTTDLQVNKVTPALFARFPTAVSLAEASPDEVRELIKPTGYYNNKAKSIQSCAAALVERFAGKVPADLTGLITLPGVGRKTANVVLGVIHKIPGWTVDTHVQRLSSRLGFSVNTDPYKIEMDLQKLFPGEDWSKLSITLIWHGRRQCFARKPDCGGCPVKHLCPSSLSAI